MKAAVNIVVLICLIALSAGAFLIHKNGKKKAAMRALYDVVNQCPPQITEKFDPFVVDAYYHAVPRAKAASQRLGRPDGGHVLLKQYGFSYLLEQIPEEMRPDAETALKIVLSGHDISFNNKWKEMEDKIDITADKLIRPPVFESTKPKPAPPKVVEKKEKPFMGGEDYDPDEDVPMEELMERAKKELEEEKAAGGGFGKPMEREGDLRKPGEDLSVFELMTGGGGEAEAVDGEAEMEAEPAMEAE